MNDELRNRRDALEIKIQRARDERQQRTATARAVHDKAIADANSPEEQINALKQALSVERAVTALQSELLEQHRKSEAVSNRQIRSLEAAIDQLETLCRSHDIDLPWVAGEAPRLN